MTAASTLERLGTIRIVPVVTIDDADRAPDVAAALVAGGIGCAEITLRTPQGLEAIRKTASLSDIIVGAGTVLTVEQVDRCVDAGAQFLVSPGFDDEVVARAQFHDVAILPGVSTATEIQRALRAGINVVKFFPADRLGGLDTIAALAAPLADARFVPSGGVNPSNAAAYLRHPAIFGISGSWMVTRDAIAAGDYDSIERLSRTAAALIVDA
jgi:2-dehydro-3-deoxyphosphogluconate aldolase / (4S)-4-hydroxy-2-oxoglutarate aldolase